MGENNKNTVENINKYNEEILVSYSDAFWHRESFVNHQRRYHMAWSIYEKKTAITFQLQE